MAAARSRRRKDPKKERVARATRGGRGDPRVGQAFQPVNDRLESLSHSHRRVAGATPWKPLILGAAAILAATIVAYVPALRAGYIWDDDAYVTENMVLRSFDGLSRIWLEPTSIPQYYPLVHTAFWMEYHVWQLRPFGYHLNNVLLHGLGAILLWRVLRHLDLPGAFVAAALFALHPVQVESVAWITERKNVLSGVLYMSSLLAFFRFCPLRAGAVPSTRRGRYYALALGLFIAALLSKTVTCSLPAVIVLLMWWKKDRLTLRELWPLTPFFVVALFFALLTVRLEVEHVGARGEEWTLTILQRCLIAGRALWFYAAKVLWPHPLVFSYPKWMIDTSLWWQYLFPLAGGGVMLTLWAWRRRLGKGPLAAVLMFAGTLLPALGFFNVYPFRYSYVADHFQYLASIGLIVLFVCVAAKLLLARGESGVQVAKVAGVMVSAACVILVWNRGHVYKDLESLWQDTIQKNPESWLAHAGLGAHLMHQGQFDDAVRHFEETIRINPSYAGAQSNLGLTCYFQGKHEAAIRHLQKATQIDPSSPRAHNNFAEVLAQLGRLDQAIEEFQTAIRLNPHFANAHFNLGTWLTKSGRFGEAMHHFEQVLRIDPGDAEARSYLDRLRTRGRSTP